MVSLLFLLLVAGGAAGWWMQWQGMVDFSALLPGVTPREEEGGDTGNGADSALTSEERYKMIAEAERKAGEGLPSAEEVADLTREAPLPDPVALNFVVSPACRDAAAAQWVNDYTLNHTNFRQAEFVRLLDESITLTDQIHKQCRNDQLLRSVIASAKEGKKPLWLAPAINALLNPEYDPDKVVGDLDY